MTISKRRPISRSSKKPRKPSSPGSMTVTVDEACEMIGFSRATFYRALEAGDIHVKKYGARTLILRSEIERFLKSLRDRVPA